MLAVALAAAIAGIILWRAEARRDIRVALAFGILASLIVLTRQPDWRLRVSGIASAALWGWLIWRKLRPLLHGEAVQQLSPGGSTGRLVGGIVLSVLLVLAAGGIASTPDAGSSGKAGSKATHGEARTPAPAQTAKTSAQKTTPAASSQSAPDTASVVQPPDQSDQAPRLPGLAPADVYLNLEAAPYSFRFGDWTYGQSLDEKCGDRTDTDTGAIMHVCIWSPSGQYGGPAVMWVDATVEGMNAQALESASWFLPYVATVPYEGADQEAAKQWVADNWRSVRTGKTLTKQIGQAVFELSGNGTSLVTLRISAVGTEQWLAQHPQ